MAGHLRVIAAKNCANMQKHKTLCDFRQFFFIMEFHAKVETIDSKLLTNLMDSQTDRQMKIYIIWASLIC